MTGVRSAAGPAQAAGPSGGAANAPAGARWAEAAAGASATAGGAAQQRDVDAEVALILRDSPMFLSMVKQLGPDWSFNTGPGLTDKVDAREKTINVRSETSIVGGVKFDENTATAGKTASVVAGVLRDRDVADIAKPGPKETKAQFVARYKEGLAEADATYNLRLITVSVEVYATGLKTNLEFAKERERLGWPPQKPENPIVIVVRSNTPGVTGSDIARWTKQSDKTPSETLELAIKAELLKKPATSKAYQARAEEAYKAATAPPKKP